MKICDACESKSDTIVEVVAVTDAADTAEPFGAGDLCAPCRDAVSEHGLVPGLIAQYAEAHPARRRARRVAGDGG